VIYSSYSDAMIEIKFVHQKPGRRRTTIRYSFVGKLLTTNYTPCVGFWRNSFKLRRNCSPGY
jgi:hypothetical protein